MNKCDKCGANFLDDCIVVWKCSECEKALKVNFSMLHRIKEWKRKNVGKHIIKCPSCGRILDDGNEKITCKCSVCGNVNGGNIEYFVGKKESADNNGEANIKNQRVDLIECPECGKKILSDSKICSYCGYPLEENAAEKKKLIKCPECGKEFPEDVKECPFCGYPIKMKRIASLLWYKRNISEFKITTKRILPIAIGVAIIIILLFLIKSCAKCEHEYDGGKITKKSTCTEMGEKTYTCSLCGETKVESIEKKIHRYIEKITKEATFEEEGEKTFTCEYCGDSYTESIPIRDDEVVVTVTSKSNLPKNSDAGRYADRVELTFDVLNRTDKIIKGVQGSLTVCDLFGEKILIIDCDFTGNSITAGESITVNDLGIDINQFMDSHLKFYSTDYSDLLFEYEVTNIVYDDGSSMKEESPRELMENKKVTVNVTDKQNLDINYNVGRYSPRVEFTFEVYNNTSKNIKGVQGILTIKDLFGVDIMSFGLDFTGQTIEANNSIVVSEMGIDINQFMDKHIKIYNTNFDDLKFEYEITSIIYEDGTTE